MRFLIDIHLSIFIYFLFIQALATLCAANAWVFISLLRLDESQMGGQIIKFCKYFNANNYQ